MFALFRFIAIMAIVCLPFRLMACGSDLQVAKKPEGLRMKGPDQFHPDLTYRDRQLWKSVLHWEDECDERARPATQDDDGDHGWINIYPIGGRQYVADIQCAKSMQNSEHLYYKITEKKDTIESRLLILEQYEYRSSKSEDAAAMEEPKGAPQGEFVRFTDSLAYGILCLPANNIPELILLRQFRGSGGCGLYTVYDVSDDCAKVKEFRAKTFCSVESPPIEKWKRYPASQRAKWRVVPNGQREEWKSSPPPKFETRCGWFTDPMSSSISLYDRDGKWAVRDPFGYQMPGEWDRTEFGKEQTIKTKDGDAYGCVCMDVKVSWQMNRILEIKNTRVQALDICRRDPGLKRWKQFSNRR